MFMHSILAAASTLHLHTHSPAIPQVTTITHTHTIPSKNNTKTYDYRSGPRAPGEAVQYIQYFKFPRHDSDSKLLQQPHIASAIKSP